MYTDVNFKKEEKNGYKLCTVYMYAGRKGFLMVGPVDYSSSRPGVNPGQCI